MVGSGAEGFDGVDARWWRVVDGSFELRGRALHCQGSLASGRLNVALPAFGDVIVNAPPGCADDAMASPLALRCRSSLVTADIIASPDRAALLFDWHARAHPGAIRVTAPTALGVSLEGRTCARFVSPSGVMRVAADGEATSIVIRNGESAASIDVHTRSDRLRLVLVAHGHGSDSARKADTILRDPSIVERTQRAFLARLSGSGLSIHSSVPALDSALLRCRAILASVEPASVRASDALWPIMGALTCGDFAIAQDWLSRCTPSSDRTDDAAFVLAAARALAWSGERGACERILPDLRSRLDALTARGNTESTDAVPALLLAALAEGAVLAETLGDPQRQSTALSCVRRLRTGRSKVTLAADDTDGVLLDVADPAGTAPALPPTGECLPAALKSAWARLVEGDASAATALAGLAAAVSAPVDAGLVMGAVVLGLLGVRADEARNRVRIAPRLSPSLLPFRMEGLRIGPSVIGLSAERRGRTQHFSIAQSGGPVPATLIFEPLINASRIAATRIDGRPATLDARPFAAGWTVPAQLSLDHERTVEVDVE